jgi:spore maturation protein CgeB
VQPSQKLLILDGIGGVPLGREMAEAFNVHGVDSAYYDCAKLPKINLYNLRAGFAKLINRADKKDIYYYLPKVKLGAIEAILNKEKPTHLLIIGFIYKFINPLLLEKLAKTANCKLYLFDTDSCNLYAKRREFVFFLEKELRIYQEIFSFSKVTTQFFRHTKNLNASHFPFGAKLINVPVHLPVKHDVLFVGSADLRRILLLEHIKEHVSIFGNRWQRNYPLISDALRIRITDRAVWGEELYTLLASANIVLNITRTHFYGAETGVNLRLFEALAAGCFLLTDDCEEVTELFEVGVEIEVFRNATELKEKVAYYLTHPAEREAIAKRGHAKFLKNYTWKIRVSDMLQKIELI